MVKAPWALVIMAMAVSTVAAAEYQPYKSDQIGEYYEYDLEGTPKERARKEARYHTKKIAKIPLKLTWRGIHMSWKALKKTSHAIETYLSNSAPKYRRGGHLDKALTDWEGALRFDPRGSHAQKKSRTGVLYIPSESWRLLKYSLYLAGFRLPRETMRTIKNMIYGTCGHAPEGNNEARS